jgi:hypothetical protein
MLRVTPNDGCTSSGQRAPQPFGSRLSGQTGVGLEAIRGSRPSTRLSPGTSRGPHVIRDGERPGWLRTLFTAARSRQTVGDLRKCVLPPLPGSQVVRAVGGGSITNLSPTAATKRHREVHRCAWRPVRVPSPKLVSVIGCWRDTARSTRVCPKSASRRPICSLNRALRPSPRSRGMRRVSIRSYLSVFQRRQYHHDPGNATQAATTARPRETPA